MYWSRLPEAIVETIFSYLSVSDHLNSCLVSVQWRNMLNKDRIWHKFCVHLSKTLTDLSWLGDSLVRDFSPPDSESLEQICKWKLRFMQNVQLRNNMRNGHYIFEEIVVEGADPIECDADAILMENVIGNFRGFRVFDIKNRVEEKETVRYSLDHVMSDFFKLVDNTCVVAQCTLVQIFRRKEDANFKLDGKFILNENDPNTINEQEMAEWYIRNINLYPSDMTLSCDHNGKFFIGAVETQEHLNQKTLHIWDIKNLKKIKTESVPRVKYLHGLFDLSISIKNHLAFIMLKTEKYEVFCYDLNKLKYTDFKLTLGNSVPLIYFGEKVVINYDSKYNCINFWDNKSSEKISHLPCSGLSLSPSTFCCAENYLIFSEIDRFLCNVNVYDMNKKFFLRKFSVDYLVKEFTFVKPDLLLVSSGRGMELWGLEPIVKIYNFSSAFCVYVHPSLTKIVVDRFGQLGILHFW